MRSFCFAILFALCAAALSGRAVAGGRVAAAELVESARAAVQAKAAEAGMRIELEVAGRVADVGYPEDAAVPQVTALDWHEPWLRSRIGVPVEVRAGGRRTVVTVWFVASVPASGDVYADGFARGEQADRLSYRTGQVDLARLQGKRTAMPASLAGMRLRHAVRAGDPVMASDFEPIPMVSARQTVRVLVNRGAVSVSVAARALADGDAGRTIPVLPSGATRPVRARVISSEAVMLEN